MLSYSSQAGWHMNLCLCQFGCYNKAPSSGQLTNNRNFFLTVLWLREPARAGSGEGSLLSCRLQAQLKGERACWSPS
jgi:hypothetical protein